MLDASRDALMTERTSVAAVYLRLISMLDFLEYRRLRVAELAEDMGLKPATVGSALRLLRRAGYLERGPRVADVFIYRLVYSRNGQAKNGLRIPPRAKAPQNSP